MYEVHNLHNDLLPEQLDKLLSLGYYRMGQTVFTTPATITDNGDVIIVLWARILLNEYTPGKRYKELVRRNRHFEITLQDARIDHEIEGLYATYRNNMDFDASQSATAYLMGTNEHNHYPTRMWQVRDAGHLIAVGYFDEGTESAAGILNFYDPAYRKYSLGKLLYLQSVQYAFSTGKRYFYPGYIALGFTKFDYKLMAGKKCMEIWDMNERVWIPYSQSDHARQPGFNDY